MLYLLPILVTIPIAFIDILETYDLFINYTFMSIFTFGIPLLLFCSPYALYFYFITRTLKVSKTGPTVAFILTMVAFVALMIGVMRFYIPIEKRIYFSESKVIKIENRALKQYKKETGLNGEIVKRIITSRKGDWGEDDMTGIQKRKYYVKIIPTDNSKKEPVKEYTFYNKNGNWIE